MGSPVLNWTLTCHDRLDLVAQHGEHDQTAVLDVLDLPPGESVGIVSQTQGVEGQVGTVGLNSTHQQYLAGQYGKDGLGVDQGRGAKVVRTTVLVNLSINQEPDRLTDVGVLGQGLKGQAAQGSQHSSTGVIQLSLMVRFKGSWVSAQNCGVPNEVTRVLTSQVGRIGELKNGPNHLLWSGAGTGAGTGAGIRVGAGTRAWTGASGEAGAGNGAGMGVGAGAGTRAGAGSGAGTGEDVCPAHARRATFLLTMPNSAPDLPSHGEAPQVDHMALHTFPTKHVAK